MKRAARKAILPVKYFFLICLLLPLAGCVTTSPPPEANANFGGSIWQDGQRRAEILFQDGGQSFAVPGGTLWTFGDTFFGRAPTNGTPTNKKLDGSISATLAWLPANSHQLPPALNYLVATNGRARSPFSLFPEEDARHLRLWPLDGVSLGKKIYLFYAMVATTDAPGPWNFHGVGTGLAMADGPLQPFTRLRPNGDCRFPVNANQILREGEWLYLYEISEQPKGLLLARVRVDRIEEPAAYEFFTGKTWTTHRAAAKVILREAYGQVSIARRPGRTGLLMATSSVFWHPREIQLRTAASPTGPWKLFRRIAVPELPGQQTELVYCTFLHPELSENPARQLVLTFCRILKGNWELSNPEWVTLPLAPGADTETHFQPRPLVGQTFIHDPSTIQRDGQQYRIFGTGPGLRAKTSPDLVHWENDGRIFAEPPAWTQKQVPGFQGTMWAPDVVRVNGKFYLYYSVSTFGQQVSAIGLATNPTLDRTATNYFWTDAGAVITSTNGGAYNTIDPSALQDRDGRLWLAFGSYWQGIFLTELNPQTGLRLHPQTPPVHLAWNNSIEAACLARHGKYYYLFVNWGECCKGTNSTYEVRVGRAEKITGPYLDRNGNDLAGGGGSPFLQSSGPIIGPGHIGILDDGGSRRPTRFSYHYYDALTEGRSRLALGKIQWTDDWPVAAP